MAGPGAGIAIKGARELGKRLSKLALKKAASRITGKILTSSKAWSKAFVHIAEHFKPAAGKASHAVFDAAYRSRQAVEKLIQQAVGKLSRAPVLTRATIDGVPAGKAVVILEREFPHQIGMIGDKPCKILRIIIDYTGRPVTAYPVEKFFGAAAVAGLIVAGSSGEAEAAPQVQPVVETYAAEEQERERRAENRCAPHGALETIIDILFSPSCSAEVWDLASAGSVEARADAAVQHIEAKLGYALDKETADNIREDVRRIWGRGTAGAE